MEMVSCTSQRDPCSRSLLTFSIRCSMLSTALTPIIKLASKHTHQLALEPPDIGRLYYIGMSQSGEKIRHHNFSHCHYSPHPSAHSSNLIEHRVLHYTSNSAK